MGAVWFLTVTGGEGSPGPMPQLEDEVRYGFEVSIPTFSYAVREAGKTLEDIAGMRRRGLGGWSLAFSLFFLHLLNQKKRTRYKS